jgi:hypothetical protein
LNAAEARELVKQHEEYCLQMGHSLPAAELELMAKIMFPTGALPEDFDHPTFTIRELEIIRNLLWKTKEMHYRVSAAHLRRALVEQGATFTFKQP